MLASAISLSVLSAIAQGLGRADHLGVMSISSLLIETSLLQTLTHRLRHNRHLIQSWCRSSWIVY